MYKLFLDDIRDPEDVFQYMMHPVYLINDEWIIVRSYDEFVKTIQEKGIPDVLSMDHDLGLEHYEHNKNPNGVIDYSSYTEKTGYDCAKWLINYCIDNKKELPTTILIHSMNIVGSQNIKSLFNSYLKSLNLPSSGS